MFAPFNIRDITISPPLILAPMSGITCSAFRRLIKRLNPGCIGLVVTEFLSVEGMTRRGIRTLQMMRFRDEERPIAVQIFGSNPARMRDGALMIQDAGVDIVDVNCGCPAPKVVRRGGGVDLMRNPELLRNILAEIRSHLKIPLTLKMRSGWDDESLNAPEIARMAQEEGVDAVTVHGRTRSQMYKGEADWDLVERIAGDLSVPVCGSGDIVDCASATGRLSGRTSGLYIGRGAMSNPRVFSQIMREQGKDIGFNPLEALEIVGQYIELLQEDFPERASIGRVKQLICRMAPRKWWWKSVILHKLKLQEILDVLHEAAAEHIETDPAPGQESAL